MTRYMLGNGCVPSSKPAVGLPGYCPIDIAALQTESAAGIDMQIL